MIVGHGVLHYHKSLSEKKKKKPFLPSPSFRLPSTSVRLPSTSVLVSEMSLLVQFYTTDPTRIGLY